MSVAYLRIAKGLPTEAAQIAAITAAAGAAPDPGMVWRDGKSKIRGTGPFDQRDFMVQSLRDGDEVWIARPSIAASSERDAEEFLRLLSARGAVLCVASTGARHRFSPDLPAALAFIRSVRSDAQAAVMEKAREARRKLGRQTFSDEQKAKAKKLWADPRVTIAEAEAKAGITGRTMHRWWGPKGTPKFGRKK